MSLCVRVVVFDVERPADEAWATETVNDGRISEALARASAKLLDRIAEHAVQGAQEEASPPQEGV